MFGWLRELLEIRYEFKAKKVEIHEDERICKSCETLRQQLEIANYEKSQLLAKVLKEPDAVPERTIAPEPTAIRPRNVPWNMRRQILEKEDREAAKLKRNAPKPASETTVETISTAELEEDLGIAAEAREAGKE